MYQRTEREEERDSEEASENTNDIDLMAKKDILRLVNRHLGHARVKSPAEGMVVLSTDIHDFSNGLPHSTILSVMDKFGFGDHLDFFKKFLSVKIKYNEREGNVARGAPLRYALTDVFCECIMLSDMSIVSQDDPLELFRCCDDTYMLSKSSKTISKAFKQYSSTLSAFGMKINEKKSGCCIINFPRGTLQNNTTYFNAFFNRSEQNQIKDPLPRPNIDESDLKGIVPHNDVCWGFLKLHEDGYFRVNSVKFNEFKNTMIEKVKSGSSLMKQVNVYNSQLKVLDMYVGKGADINDWFYNDSVLNAYEDIHAHFGDESSLEYFKRVIKEKFLGESKVDVMEAWAYWPVTAGGLGLTHALIEPFINYHHQVQDYQVQITIVPKDWCPIRRRNMNVREIKEKTGGDPNAEAISWTNEEEAERVWTYWKNFGVLAGGKHDLDPPHTAEFDKLVAMFCSRGSEMRQSGQSNLSTYWKWIVFNYSDQVLSTFGSLEFASAGSIPINLILSTKRG
ncbi:hypothetical protein AKO1_009902 [Acrasis kona]|uniref:Reverse transcriptase domain-containing protein n=1 Tax=Acrasis kona TaxID=1008807 RepID=A0AAW2ZQA9_9EUKA